MSEAVSPGPLAGITVLDVSTILAGPLACQILGDYGADVIKIEHPQRGDGMRGHGPSLGGVPIWWSEVSRNKTHIGLYLGDPEGAGVFLEMAARADVVVENFRPGTLERWGVGWEQLHAKNPGLILARVTGWGQVGPYANRPGFGTLAEAMSGFAYLTGDPDGPPTLPAFGLADSICGMTAAGLIAIALYHRDAGGGEGQVVDLSILEGMMTAAGPGPTIYDQTGVVRQRTGNRSVNNAPRNLYRTADDHWVAVSTSANSVAERVLRLVGHPEVIDEAWFATGHGRAQHADLLDGWVADWIGARDAAHVLAAFEDAGAAVAPVYASDELLDDPHIQATEMITTVEDPQLGSVRMHNVLGRLSATPGSIRWTGRPLGADTDRYLTDELGMSAERIAGLRGRGVVA
ncbi:MAG TPA: CoA transferase [Acidimicrobiia bacterium]|jgi:crotonobetainyl-CoA:carnitine CoA-transferase CaiB-like acyl-CoA transferase|nr:CoA transferase [Acidimicrobiia bacterium]